MVATDHLCDALKAAESVGELDIPKRWLELLAQGWKIVPTSCSCKGEWAWLTPNDSMHGCVCHNTPE